MAILEAPYSYEDPGSLKYWSTVASERLTRTGSIKMYRWRLRSLGRALRKVLDRTERELRRTVPPGLPPT